MNGVKAGKYKTCISAMKKYVLREPKDFCRSVMNENFEKNDMPG